MKSEWVSEMNPVSNTHTHTVRTIDTSYNAQSYYKQVLFSDENENFDRVRRARE